MAAILFLYAGRALLASRFTGLVEDELLTYAEAQLPSLNALWWMLKNAPAALDPPLHPFLSFFALRLPLAFPLAFRLPAIVAYGAMMLCIFIFLRRRAPASIALLASTVPMWIPVFQFAIQARPYALVLGFSGCALVFWQRATEWPKTRVGALIGLYLSLTCALLSHYLAGLIFIPLVAGELFRSFRRGLDPAIWVTFAASALAVFSYLPLLPAAALYRANPWHGVLAEDLWQTYGMGVAPPLLIIISLCSVLWLAPQPDDGARPRITLRLHEAIAVIGLYLIPIIAFAIAKTFTRSYVPRYALMFSIAAAIMTGIVICALTRKICGASSIVLLLVLLSLALPVVNGAIHWPAQNTGGITASKLPILDRWPALPIVEPAWDDYERLYLFGPNELKSRMILVPDPAMFSERTNAGLSTRAVQLGLHLPYADYADFIPRHPQFLLLGTYRLRDRFIREGFQILVVGKIFDWDLYLVQAPRGKTAP